MTTVKSKTGAKTTCQRIFLCFVIDTGTRKFVFLMIQHRSAEKVSRNVLHVFKVLATRHIVYCVHGK